jgi:hypothetical protein
MRTLRFLLVVRAGRLARIQGRQVLRLTQKTRPRKPCMRESVNALPPDLFSDWG